MSQPPTNPPGSPPRNQAPSSPLQMNDDFADYEGDPTSINQIPSPGIPSPQIAPRPVSMHPSPSAQPPLNQFATASPSLSHIGAPVAQYAAASGHGGHANAVAGGPPGPPRGQQGPGGMGPMMQPTQMTGGL